MCKKASVSVLMRLYHENKMKIKKDHIDTTYIDSDLDMNTNMLNIQCVWWWWCLYVLSNTKATFEAQATDKQHWGKLNWKKRCL